MLELKTVAVIPDGGCFSAALWKGKPFAVTLERTFDDGKPIIRDGSFLCQRSYFERGKYWTFEIMVPGHTRVLFHRGNFESDSLGCVLVAESFAVIDGKLGVGDSHGLTELLALTDGLKQFNLLVSGRGN